MGLQYITIIIVPFYPLYFDLASNRGYMAQELLDIGAEVSAA